MKDRSAGINIVCGRTLPKIKQKQSMDQMKNEMDLNAARPPLISPPTTMTVDYYQIKLISMNDAFLFIHPAFHIRRP